MVPAPRITPKEVVVVGGGVAALETVLALHRLGEAQLHTTLIAPEPEFVLRPLATAVPFAAEPVQQLALADVMREQGGAFVRDAVLRVDADARQVWCAGAGAVPYDVLVLAVGASTAPAFTHVLTFSAEPLALGGILADLEQGWSRSVAFVVPNGSSWPLPLYELALLTAEQVWSMGMDDVAVHLVTPEDAPLDIFGAAVSETVRGLLRDGGVILHTGADPHVTRSGHIDLGPGRRLDVDRVVALPVLHGPRLDGVPADARGFIPVDGYGRVRDLDAVYAVGDATDGAIKQGGLACQQADVAATHIAAGAGAELAVTPFEPVLRGRLLTGRGDRFLRREGAEPRGTVSREPLWWPPGKVSGHHLTPYLAARGLVAARATPPEAGIDVEAGVAGARRAAGTRPAGARP